MNFLIKKKHWNGQMDYALFKVLFSGLQHLESHSSVPD